MSHTILQYSKDGKSLRSLTQKSISSCMFYSCNDHPLNCFSCWFRFKKKWCLYPECMETFRPGTDDPFPCFSCHPLWKFSHSFRSESKYFAPNSDVCYCILILIPSSTGQSSFLLKAPSYTGRIPVLRVQVHVLFSISEGVLGCSGFTPLPF